MNTKLTLTIQQSVIEEAKKYAKSKGRSLSDIIENYLKAITTDANTSVTPHTPVTDTLKGTFKAPQDFDYKKELTKALTKKYQSNE
ncbi:MAG: hypothetical protein IPH20_18210 [Bacteroidales bacterium]|nr:hypothetical protein [Bacteroidales bacterium]